mmetsp:Transcript_27754/g.65410  ORF Transcript_27754/g.65410 Transcript_27754/m.65410 type:complete len:245 (-) Transcript_27754:1114-1848(-)
MTSPLARSLGLELGHEGRHARLELLQLVAHLHRCRRIHPHPALRRHRRASEDGAEGGAERAGGGHVRGRPHAAEPGLLHGRRRPRVAPRSHPPRLPVVGHAGNAGHGEGLVGVGAEEEQHTIGHERHEHHARGPGDALELGAELGQRAEGRGLLGVGVPDFEHLAHHLLRVARCHAPCRVHLPLVVDSDRGDAGHSVADFGREVQERLQLPSLVSRRPRLLGDGGDEGGGSLLPLTQLRVQHLR